MSLATESSFRWMRHGIQNSRMGNIKLSPEEEFIRQCQEKKLPLPLRQSRKPWEGTGRRFRADFLWESPRLILEVDGGTWSGGRHTRGTGYASDCEKHALAILAGYTVLRATSAHVYHGQALEWVSHFLDQQPQIEGAKREG
jgi:hypothetical protein